MLRYALWTSLILVGLAAAPSARAYDMSILHFSHGVYAVAPAGNRLHRVQIPGERVLSSEVYGEMARVDTEEGANLVASVRNGVAGRQVFLDMGAVKQVTLGKGMAFVTAETGTALYFPAAQQLVGLRLSDGYPRGIMVVGDIAAVNWGTAVALYGVVHGKLYRLVFPVEGLADLHVGDDTVVTVWSDQGTYLHLLNPQGFFTAMLSEEVPGELSARSGMRRWQPVIGADQGGAPFEEPRPLGGPGLSSVPMD